MSVDVLTLIWKHYPDGTGSLILALALADWAHADGYGIYPSVAQMVEKTRMSERAVQYALKKMKASGWLVQVAPGGIIKGKRLATTYRIPIEWIPPGAVGRVQILRPLPKSVEKLPTRVQSETDMGANNAANGCKAFAPQPLVTVINRQARGKEIGKQNRTPVWKQSAEQLVKSAEQLKISSYGKTREELISLIEAKQK